MKTRTKMYLLGILVAVFSLSLIPNHQDTQKMVLHIKGMHCVDCATILEKTLIRIDGIKKAEINVRGHIAIIEYHDQTICPGMVAAAFKKAGIHMYRKYHARPKPEMQRKQKDAGKGVLI